MASVGLSLSTRMKLSASPHMQQAVRLLQLSTVEFVQEMQQALADNPFLEELDLEESPVEAQSAADELSLPSESDSEGADPLDVPFGEAPVFEGFEQLATREEVRDPFEGLGAGPGTSSSGSSSSEAADWVCAETNLRTHLLEQICGWGVDQRRQIAAVIVVDSLDEDGYLRSDVLEGAAATGIEPALTAQEVQDAIRFVQACDPCGVGARDLGECLALQIDSLDDATPAKALASRIIRQHLHLLARHHHAALRQALDCDDAALNEACSLIRRLDPRPGHQYSSQRSEYVVPDVIVRVRDGELVTQVNPAARPSARLNQYYVDCFRGARHQNFPALSQQLQEARWLMHNVEQRFVTIQRVAEAIVRRQRAFFECGEIALKPLVLREVADDLGIHESTVSRATGNKYMDTPRGMFEFRHFFSRSLATETGGACSAAAVRALMIDMIAGESDGKPLSDVALAKKLGENGVRVSRRTVTKYRNLMKVAPVELRKRA